MVELEITPQSIRDFLVSQGPGKEWPVMDNSA